MSGFIKVEEKNVTIEHFSTSSAIKITIINDEEIEPGQVGPVEQILWLDYTSMDNLVEACVKAKSLYY